jgi:hypothetical protein
MALAVREHRAAVVEVEMSGLQKLDADQPNIALADDLLSKKSPVFAHPEEVLDDQTLTLTLADKRSLLASWASDALGVNDSPSLRQLPSGAVVRVDDNFRISDPQQNSLGDASSVPTITTRPTRAIQSGWVYY